MQYLLIFLTVLVVLVCMNGFIFLTLRQLTRHIREQLEGRLIRELSVFDRLYEEKAEQLERLKAEKALSDSNIFPQAPEPKREEPMVCTAGIPSGEIPVSRTSNPDFYQEYRYVKHAFDLDYEQMIRQVMAAGKDPDWHLGEQADAILLAVPEEAAFELSTLDGAEQLELLYQVLEPEVNGLIDQYLQEEEVMPPDFGILEFLSYLKNVSRLYRDEVTVYTGKRMPDASRPGIRVVYDPSICEGIRIVRGNRLYDYSF